MHLDRTTRRSGSTFALVCIGNTDDRQQPCPFNQQIGMRVSASVYGR